MKPAKPNKRISLAMASLAGWLCALVITWFCLSRKIAPYAKKNIYERKRVAQPVKNTLTAYVPFACGGVGFCGRIPECFQTFGNFGSGSGAADAETPL